MEALFTAAVPPAPAVGHPILFQVVTQGLLHAVKGMEETDAWNYCLVSAKLGDLASES